MASWYKSSDPSLESSGPLCLFSLQVNHPQNTESDDASSAAESVVVHKVTPWEMGLHIADHLHFLMIVTLQLLSAMDGASHGEDAQSKSDALSTHIPEPGDDQMNARLEDLPSEVQGPIAWFDGDNAQQPGIPPLSSPARAVKSDIPLESFEDDKMHDIFRFAYPEIYNRNQQERYSACHSAHRTISTTM